MSHHDKTDLWPRRQQPGQQGGLSHTSLIKDDYLGLLLSDSAFESKTIQVIPEELQALVFPQNLDQTTVYQCTELPQHDTNALREGPHRLCHMETCRVHHLESLLKRRESRLGCPSSVECSIALPLTLTKLDHGPGRLRL
jgi:hypothetical protein